MNDAPPPLTPASPQTPYQQPQPQASPPGTGSGGKWALACGLGCLALIVIAAVGSYFVYGFVKSKATEVVAGFTTTEAVKVEMPELSQAQIDAAQAKYDAFTAGMGGGELVPLVLTGDDINALIIKHPSFSALRDRASVTIEDDKLRSQVSVNLDELEIPVKFIADAVKGKYFNGEATFALGMAVGRPVLYIEGLEVNGAVIPEEFMKELRKENLLEKAVKDPDSAAFFERIEDLKIENGELIVVPKAAP